MAKKTQIEELLELIEDLGMMVVDQNGTPFIQTQDSEQQKVFSIQSISFLDFLRHQYLESYGKLAFSPNLKEVIDHLGSMARNSGNTITTAIRNAYVNKHAYVDSANDKAQIMKIGKDGWSLSTEPSVSFIKSSSMAALPTPINDGDFVDLIEPYLNLADDNSRYLVVTFLVSYFLDLPSKCILLVNGEQGSGKTSFTKLIRELLDPSIVKTQPTPSSKDDLMVAAVNSALLCIDNVTKISLAMMDVLCQLSTGAGFRKRMLYTNLDEVIVQLSRSMVINGISADMISATDLLSRSIQVILPAIIGNDRLIETEFWDNFYNDRPKILGGLYTLVGQVIAVIDDVKLDNATRMTDFCKVGVAVERVLSWPENSFMDALKAMQAEAMEIALESDVTATGIQKVMANRANWEGTAEGLLSQMNDYCGFDLTSQTTWPKSARSLGIKLSKIMPALRDQGIVIEKTKSGPRKITITNIAVTRPEKPESSLSKFDAT